MTNYLGLVKVRAGKKRTTRLTFCLGRGFTAWTAQQKLDRESASSARPRRSTTTESFWRWMDHYVKGMDNGVDQEKPVRYFVMGRNEWARI